MGYVLDGCGCCGGTPCECQGTRVPTTLLLTLTNSCGIYEIPIVWQTSGPCAFQGTMKSVIMLGCITPGGTDGCCCNSTGDLTFDLYCQDIATSWPTCDTANTPQFPSQNLLTITLPTQNGIGTVGMVNLGGTCQPLILNFKYAQSDPMEAGCSQVVNGSSRPCDGDIYTVKITEMPSSGCYGYCVYGQSTTVTSCSNGCGCHGSQGSPGEGCPAGMGYQAGVCQ